MTFRVAAFAVLLTTAVAPPLHAMDVAAVRAGAQAEGCTVTRASSCNTTITGRLEAGDCTDGKGRYRDTIAFEGVSGHIVTITLRPMSPLLTKTTLALVPPTTNTSPPPSITLTAGASIRYPMPSSGTWNIVVAGGDPSATGDYILQIDCRPDSPRPAQSCVTQYVVCGQSTTWALSADSCRFRSTPNRALGEWLIYAYEGDHLTATMTSTAFQPKFGIYGFTGLLETSKPVSTTRSELVFAVPGNNWYAFGTTSSADFALGEYRFDVNCSASSCLSPLFLKPVANVSIPTGSTGVVSPSVHAVGRVTYQLRDRDNVTLTQSSSASVTVPAYAPAGSYTLQAMTPCGEAFSNSFTLTRTPASKNRRRSAPR